MHANDLDPDIKQGILRQFESQLGWSSFRQLKETYGEDALIDLFIAQSVSRTAPTGTLRPERREDLRALSPGQLRVACAGSGFLMGLGLGMLFALMAWGFHAGGIPYRHLTASTFHACGLALFLVPLTKMSSIGKKTDFRSILVLLGLVGLLGGLIGLCQWRTGVQSRICTALIHLGATFNDGGQIIMGISLLVGAISVILWILSLGQIKVVNPFDVYAVICTLLLCVIVPIILAALVLFDAPQDPMRVLPIVESYTVSKLIAFMALTGALLGAISPVRIR